MLLIVHRRGLEADQLQLPVLPRRPAVDPEVADRGGGDRRRRPVAALLDDRLPAAVADRRSSCSSSTSSTRSSTPSASSTRRPGRPGPGDRRSWSTRSTRRLQGARPRRLGGAVGGADGDRHRAHGRAVPLRRAQGAVLMQPWSSAGPSSTFVRHASC